MVLGDKGGKILTISRKEEGHVEKDEDSSGFSRYGTYDSESCDSGGSMCLSAGQDQGGADVWSHRRSVTYRAGSA